MSSKDERGIRGIESAVSLLERSRAMEKAQTLFYRELASQAEEVGRLEDSERLNGLHADEQHHLSRLTARVLEMGSTPADLRSVPRPEAILERWEATARTREEGEIEWYEELLASHSLEAKTEGVIREILTTERHHHETLGGKWMPA